jgi:N-methylhydantoinase A
VDDELCVTLQRRFDEEYVRLFGEAAQAVFQSVEIFSIRIDARVELGFAPLTPSNGKEKLHRLAPKETRPVFWPQEADWVPTAVHHADVLEAGVTIEGPAIVELPHTAVSVPAGQRLRRDSMTNLILTRN